MEPLVVKNKGFVLKDNTYSFFRSDCFKCSQVNQCISATGITSDDYEYLLKLKGYKRVATDAMIAGIKNHEEQLQHYKTMEDYGPKLLRNEFLSGKVISISEIRVCSRFYGFKGAIDLLAMRYDEKTQTIDFNIIDIKPCVSARYILQLAAYGLILSDPNFEIIYDEVKNGKKKSFGERFLPEIPLNVNITLHIHTDSERKVIPFMIGNKLVKGCSGYKYATLGKAEEKRKLHGFGLWLIPELLKDEEHPRQRFFGKRKTLVKSPPVVKQ